MHTIFIIYNIYINLKETKETNIYNYNIRPNKVKFDKWL